MATTLIMFLLVLPLSNGAVVRAIGDSYLEKPTTAGRAMKQALGIWAKLLWTSLLAGLMIMLGLIALIIPGIYLMFRYWFVHQSVVLEGISGGAALKRSGALMKGNYGTAFVLGILILIISLAAAFAGGFVGSPIVGVVVRILIQTAVFIFSLIAGVVFYFSARCRLESFDLDLLAESVALPEDAAPQSSV
jgi:hypothetical protein